MPDTVETPGVDEAAIAATFVQPDQVFGGQCDDLLSEDEVGGILGVPVVLEHRDGTYPGNQIWPNLGGMRCNWYSESGVSLLLIVLPSGVLTVGEQEGCSVDALSGDMLCAVDTTVNSIRVSGAVLQAGSGKGDSLQAPADKVEAIVAERLAATDAVSVPVTSATAWTSTCPVDVLQADAGIRALIVGQDAFAGGLDNEPPYSSVPAEEEVITRTDLAASCLISYLVGDSYNFIYSALGGGRWNEAALAHSAGAHYVDIEGFDAVIVRLDSSTGSFVDAFLDDNWISAEVRSTDAAYPVLRAIAQRLG